MYLHNISLIYSKMLRIIQDDNIRIIKKTPLVQPRRQVYISFKSSGCSWDYKAALRLLYVSLSSVLVFKGMIHLLLITCLNKLIKHESLGRHLYIQYITLNRSSTSFGVMTFGCSTVLSLSKSADWSVMHLPSTSLSLFFNPLKVNDTGCVCSEVLAIFTI